MKTLLDSLPAPSRIHRKARLERGSGYPERFPVPDDKVPWRVAFPEYAPPYYLDPAVLRNAGVWADPEPWTASMARYESLEGEVPRDRDGRPLNPRGRTGLAGRGKLGRHGANFSADPVVTRVRDGRLEALLICRGDCREWALPGGMVDAGESFRRAAARELHEEAGVKLDFGTAHEVFAGYVDDPRNTDHAWMEACAFHLHIEGDLVPQGGDDADDAAWRALTLDQVQHLYASHWETVARALAAWERATGHRVAPDGRVS